VGSTLLVSDELGDADEVSVDVGDALEEAVLVGVVDGVLLGVVDGVVLADGEVEVLGDGLAVAEELAVHELAPEATEMNSDCW
jgi:hypothetical protein